MIGRDRERHPRSTVDSGGPLVRCRQLVHVYQVGDLEVQALQGLDLSVNRGEIVALVGASGSGKSTLLNVIGGLVRPTAGEIEVDGVDLRAATRSEIDVHRRSRVGFVWQQTARNLLPTERAVDNVATVAAIGGLRRPAEAAERMLDAVGLGHRARHRTGELSGGEQQRVAVAVALVNGPDLLLADEPTGQLDEETRDELYRLMADLRDRTGLTQLIASHDPDVADHVDRVVMMRDGSAAAERIGGPRPSRDAEPHSGVADGGAEPRPGPEPGHEVLVVDGTGRVRLPPDMARAAGIGDRAIVERVGDELRLRPASPPPRREGDDR